MVSNPFDGESVARRYAHGRPYYHGSALSLAARQLGIDRVGVAVDVGCGTGLSTRAVRELADQVVACDVSPAMVRAAERHPRTHYVVAGAERIPLRDATAGELHRTIVDETGPYFPDDRPADFVFGIRVWTTVRRR